MKNVAERYGKRLQPVTFELVRSLEDSGFLLHPLTSNKKILDYRSTQPDIIIASYNEPNRLDRIMTTNGTGLDILSYRQKGPRRHYEIRFGAKNIYEIINGTLMEPLSPDNLEGISLENLSFGILAENVSHDSPETFVNNFFAGRY